MMVYNQLNIIKSLCEKKREIENFDIQRLELYCKEFNSPVVDAIIFEYMIWLFIKDFDVQIFEGVKLVGYK